MELKERADGRRINVHVRILYDNRSLSPGLISGWGFSCLVGEGLLFDTGGSGRELLANMEVMGIDPMGIRTVVLSHAHGDHTGGLWTLLDAGVRPTVYVPRSFPARFRKRVRARTALVEVHKPMEILPGVHTTGEVGLRIVEQSLAVETGQGLVVITGCAHPGVVTMVRSAQASAGDFGTRSRRPHLVLGGFHLGGTGTINVERIVADFRRMGVRRVAPCHCTGERAMGVFAEEYGEGFIQVGVGRVITVDSEGSEQGGGQ